eukprot:1138506-Pelagomonas_calceolata.AAC.3
MAGGGAKGGELQKDMSAASTACMLVLIVVPASHKEEMFLASSLFIHTFFAEVQCGLANLQDSSKNIFVLAFSLRQDGSKRCCVLASNLFGRTHSAAGGAIRACQPAGQQQEDEVQRGLASLQDGSKEAMLKEARIIGCTTTGLAGQKALIMGAVSPGIVVVEEAAELLESHVLTSLSPDTQHLIMIGDHKQLRPKVEYYPLSVQSGNGHDLNVSLFERLVVQGFPFATLTVQHRMHPGISALIKHTYPGPSQKPALMQYCNMEIESNGLMGNRDSIPRTLVDHASTGSRPPLLGFSSS